MRVLSLALGLALVVQWGATHSAETEAQWVASEAGATSLLAAVPPPVIDTCVATSAILGLTPKVTITWHFFAASQNPPMTVAFYTGAGGLGGAQTGPLASGNYSTTGPASGVYTTVFPGSLLGATLGNTTAIYLEARHSKVGWVSTRASAVSSFALLGLNGQCTITPV